MPLCTRHPNGGTFDEVTAVMQLPPEFAVRRLQLLRYFHAGPAAIADCDTESAWRAEACVPGCTGSELHDRKADSSVCVEAGKCDLFDMRYVHRLLMTSRQG